MNNIFNSVKLDFYIVKSIAVVSLLSAVVLSVVSASISSNPPIIIGIVLLVSAFFMGSIFGVAEKNNLNKLYGILPVERQQTVIGRYLFTISFGLQNAALASILAYGLAAVINYKFSGLLFAAWLCGSFLFFCFLVSVQFPLYFKYDYTKIAAFTTMPFVILFILVTALIKKQPQLFGQSLHFFTQNHYMIWLIGIGGGLLLLAISMFISIEFYKNREL